MTPTQRVLRFVADWSRAWTQARDDGESEAARAALWAEASRELIADHFFDALATLGDFPEELEHGPGGELVIDSLEEGERARLVTKWSAGGKFYLYELRRVDDDFRIVSIQGRTDPPKPLRGSPELVPVDARDAILAQAVINQSLAPIEEGQHRPAASLFEDGREVVVNGERSAIEVRRVGELTSRSGVLATYDFTSVHASDLTPLAKRVSPGVFPVDVAIAFGVPIGFRLAIGDPRKTVNFHPAEIPAGGNVVGVDAANVTVFDVASFMTLDEHDKGVFDERAMSVCAPDFVQWMSLEPGPPGAIAVLSGLGDGQYPCYWGVDADGVVTELVVDFLVVG